MTQDSRPSRSRKPTARTSAVRSPHSARAAASDSSPGFRVTTRKIAALVRVAATGCGTGVVTTSWYASSRYRNHPNRGGANTEQLNGREQDQARHETERCSRQLFRKCPGAARFYGARLRLRDAVGRWCGWCRDRRQGDVRGYRLRAADASGVLAYYAAPTRGESGFALKVAIRDGEATEHFWAVDIERRNDKILATINNEPETVSTVTFGQRLEVPEADITDWTFLRNGKFVGNYTVRALFKTMPPEDVARIKSMMESP